MGFLSGLFGGGGGSSKTTVKREIPKPTAQETELLNQLMGMTRDDSRYQIRPDLRQTLEHPYQTDEAIPNWREIIRSGYMVEEFPELTRPGGPRFYNALEGGAYGYLGIPFGGRYRMRGLRALLYDPFLWYDEVTNFEV